MAILLETLLERHRGVPSNDFVADAIRTCQVQKTTCASREIAYRLFRRHGLHIGYLGYRGHGSGLGVTLCAQLKTLVG